MAYIAIVAVEGERVAKYAEFETQAEADAHVAAHGGFVAANPPGNSFTWRVVGQTVTDEAPPERVPEAVHRFKFKQAAMDSSQLDAIKAQYANMSEASKLYWTDASLIRRDSAFVTELQGLMGYTDEQVDNFFRNAAKIKL